MDIKTRFSDKLSKILFLEVNCKKVNEIFGTKINEDLYLPIKSSNILEEVKGKKNLDQIPISFFIEGMIFVLGADEKFKFNNYYKQIVLSIKDSTYFVKGKVVFCVKEKNYEDAYILLKGLLQVTESREIYDKAIMLVEELRSSDKMYKYEELELLDKAKLDETYALPYLYEAIIRREEKDYEKALFCINNYISKGGEETIEITELKEALRSSVDYETAKTILYDDPKGALNLLLPMLNEFGDDAAIYYYVGVAYRILENYEKAIYYLNEALAIDNNLVEVVNEIGINYASIGEFATAIAYLRKAFEATKSIEICTNLIMCYINAGQIKDARNHLDIAKKLDPNDEIVAQLENMLK